LKIVRLKFLNLRVPWGPASMKMTRDWLLTRIDTDTGIAGFAAESNDSALKE